MKIVQFTKRALVSLLAFALLVGVSAFAQTADDTSKDKNKDKSSDTTDSQTAQSSVQDTAPGEPAYTNSNAGTAVSLGTGEAISLYPQPRNDQTLPNGEYVEGQQSVALKSKDYKYQLLYGLSASSVYTNSFGGIGTTSDIVSTSINPYLAVFMPTRTSRYLIQYSSIVTPNDLATGGPQAYHTVTLNATGSFTDRWFWTAQSSGSYGSESARLQGPLSFLVVDSTPVADTATAVLLSDANVSFVESSLGLGYLISRRDKINFSVSHIYTGIADDPASGDVATHSNAIGGKVDYEHEVSRRVSLSTFGEAETVLTSPACYTYGGGVGISIKASHSVDINLSGGPQSTTSACGAPLSGTFAGSIVKTLARQSRIYASANREFTTIPGLSSRWEDNATVGFSQGIQRLTLITDAGYIRGDAISTTPAYHGYFVAPRIRYKIINSMAFTAGYRSFHGTGGDILSGNLSYASAGIEWFPAPMQFR